MNKYNNYVYVNTMILKVFLYIFIEEYHVGNRCIASTVWMTWEAHF